MTRKQIEIVNKIRLLVKLNATDELGKEEYYQYLSFAFSCHHCKYEAGKCGEFVNCITVGGGKEWCITWLENLRLDKRKELCYNKSEVKI